MTEKNTIIFADGQKIENLEEINLIAASKHMKILINEDKIVLVRISSPAENK
ncbi:MAG: hypothetical protein GXY49_02515 [Syntrophomonadaceae bacterium]|nr:hypothetical protein [Syntrophomonadaceae bacterium]